MRLNSIEYHLMNNPVREIVQRNVAARRLLSMGGRLGGGSALELGCGRGVGAEIILDVFGADSVDAFDLDMRMVTQARNRLRSREDRARFWIGNAAMIAAVDSTYDAVFDFGVIHHIDCWRDALGEIGRILKPGGRFYAEEPLRRTINHPVARWLTRHPRGDRFDASEFTAGLQMVGLEKVETIELWGWFAWFVAVKPESS